jgi:hypothetical protein
MREAFTQWQEADGRRNAAAATAQATDQTAFSRPPAVGDGVLERGMEVTLSLDAI